MTTVVGMPDCLIHRANVIKLFTAAKSFITLATGGQISKMHFNVVHYFNASVD
jgi:hypothetical protein